MCYLAWIGAIPANLYGITLLARGEFTGSLGTLLALLNIAAAPGIWNLWNEDEDRGVRNFLLLLTVPFAPLYGVFGIIA